MKIASDDCSESSNAPGISICIPVYETERYLMECLSSIGRQSFRDYEIIVVNDGSDGKDDEGRSAEKIIKLFSKEYCRAVRYYRFSTNKGLVEARRKAVSMAEGKYIMIVDSDDQVYPDCLSHLYEAAERSDADILQGKTEFITTQGISDENSKRVEHVKSIMDGKVNKKDITALNGRDIFRGFLIHDNQSGFLWGKLIRREKYLKALSMIPPVYSVFSEDFLQYFWISYLADSYRCTDELIYRYRIDTGISSSQKIRDMKRWEKVCSTSSVYTAIYNTINEMNIELQEDEAIRLEELSYLSLGNNIMQLRRAVDEEYQEEAYKLLKDYWGSELVESVEDEMIRQGVLR